MLEDDPDRRTGLAEAEDTLQQLHQAAVSATNGFRDHDTGSCGQRGQEEEEEDAEDGDEVDKKKNNEDPSIATFPAANTAALPLRAHGDHLRAELSSAAAWRMM
jgi:hypothetical protein